MGAKQSSGNAAPRVRTFSTPGTGSASGPSSGPHLAIGGAHGAGNSRPRTRSLVTFGETGPSHSLGIPSSSNNVGAAGAGSPDSDSSSPEEGAPIGLHAIRNFPQSLPIHLLALHGLKCPVCSKFIPPDDIECHLVICLTKPRITYNADVLTEDKGECVICLDDLNQGDTIARLPCLCIYHKGCIDKWFEKNRSCPEHPQD